MNCSAAHRLLFRGIDSELSDYEAAELESHLSGCASCAREYRLLCLPSRIAGEIPPFEPSPFFHRRLSARVEGELQTAAGWQVFFRLARLVIPALGGITLALLSVFAYFQLSGNEPDLYLYRAYNRVFITEDQPHRMLVAEQGEITDESVLSAIAERESNLRRNGDLK